MRSAGPGGQGKLVVLMLGTGHTSQVNSRLECTAAHSARASPGAYLQLPLYHPGANVSQLDPAADHQQLCRCPLGHHHWQRCAQQWHLLKVWHILCSEGDREATNPGMWDAGSLGMQPAGCTEV
jgi:hypothetical protein